MVLPSFILSFLAYSPSFLAFSCHSCSSSFLPAFFPTFLPAFHSFFLSHSGGRARRHRGESGGETIGRRNRDKAVAKQEVLSIFLYVYISIFYVFIFLHFSISVFLYLYVSLYLCIDIFIFLNRVSTLMANLMLPSFPFFIFFIFLHLTSYIYIYIYIYIDIDMGRYIDIYCTYVYICILHTYIYCIDANP
jgi:hypothetical protein